MLKIENIHKIKEEIVRDMYFHEVDENEHIYIFELRSILSDVNEKIKVVLHKEGFEDEYGNNEYSLRIAYYSPIQFDLRIPDLKNIGILLGCIGKLIDKYNDAKKQSQNI